MTKTLLHEQLGKNNCQVIRNLKIIFGTKIIFDNTGIEVKKLAFYAKI
jgi:hypothetical protein